MPEKLKFDIHEVVVEPENLRFDETSLNSYIQTEGSYYDYYGASLSLAEKNLQNKELMHEKLFNERFVEAKENGDAVALAEAKAKLDPVVVDLRSDVIDAKYIVTRLKQHLRAWDKNHDNAQSLGHMLRKQLDKINDDSIIMSSSYAPKTWGHSTIFPDSNQDADPSEGGFESDLNSSNFY